MKVKDNVKFGNVYSAIAIAVIVVNDIFNKHGIECVITSFNDSKHSEKSLHYVDQAFDVRSKNIPTEDLKFQILNQIKSSLTQDFDILYENPALENQHFHIEYQP